MLNSRNKVFTMKRIMAFFLTLSAIFVFAACESFRTDNEQQSSLITSKTESISTGSIISDMEAEQSSSQTQISSVDETTSHTSSTAETVTSSTSNTSSRNTTSSKKSSSSEKASSAFYNKFKEKLYVYKSDNVERKDGSGEHYAYLSVYTTEDNEAQMDLFKKKFADTFGFSPVDTVVCESLGMFIVDGYDAPQAVFNYYVYDDTYNLFTDKFYVIKKQLCDDGSAWVGFPIPHSLDERWHNSRVSKLEKEMNRIFCEWTGYEYSFIKANPDKFCVETISEAGIMRTKEGELQHVIYYYTRGVNMPVSTNP